MSKPFENVDSVHGDRGCLDWLGCLDWWVSICLGRRIVANKCLRGTRRTNELKGLNEV